MADLEMKKVIRVIIFFTIYFLFGLSRSSFRDVLRGVEEGEPPNETIKFGREILKIDSWFRKAQYDWFCKVNYISFASHEGPKSKWFNLFELFNKNSTFASLFSPQYMYDL